MIFWTSWSECLGDRCLDPGAVTADLLQSLHHHGASKDGYSISYSRVTLRSSWFVGITQDRWKRMELEVENFKGGIIARRCMPPILPHQEQE